MSTNRIKTIGLALVVVFALGAIVASAAQAGEYYYCKELTTKTGHWESGCKKENSKHEGKFEKTAGAGPKPKYASTTGVAVLKEGTTTVECKKSTDKGEITGVKTDTDEVTFEECASGGVSCQNIGTKEKPKPVGIIETDLLATKLIDHGETGFSGLEPKEGEVWTEFVSQEGIEKEARKEGKAPEFLQAEFECGGKGEGTGILFKVKGSVSAVTTPVNTMTTTFTLKFAKGKGEQDLLTQQGSGLFVASEEIAEGTITTEEAVEVRAT